MPSLFIAGSLLAVTFVSFFPQLVAGPIERAKNLLPQFDEVHEFEAQRVTRGLRLMMWGYFEKIIVADNIAHVVDRVFGTWDTQNGLALVLATVLFAFQIYCDFGGYSHIAIGTARVLGFRLMDNFNNPYFSKSIAEFWTRWHISLSSWFQDYIFEPLVWHAKDATRASYMALGTVFLLSGLWHGAKWSFVVWGLMHAVYRIVGQVSRKPRRKLYKYLRLNTKSWWFHVGQTLCTFMLVCLSYVFFRAGSFTEAVGILHRLFSPGKAFSVDTLMQQMFAGWTSVLMIALALSLLFVKDLLCERGFQITERFERFSPWVRYGCYLAAGEVFLWDALANYGQPVAAFLYFQF